MYPDDLITVGEAARRSAVDQSTIRRWFDSGKIDGELTPGGTRKISARSLETAMERARIAKLERTRSRRKRPQGASSPVGAVSDDPFDAVVHLAKVCDGWREWTPRRSLKTSDLELLSRSVQTLVAALEDVGWVAEEAIRDRLDNDEM